MVKRVLMVAYHFPPMNVSSGIQRTLRFAQYLPEFGWEPIVLSAHPRAYPGTSSAGLAEIPETLCVKRAFALDTARHLSWRGRYPQWLAIPDQWWTWALGAVPAGLELIRRFRPDVLWSTYPVATAHVIGNILHRLTGIPWVADFRDPMAQEDYPSHPLKHRAYERIEASALRHCERAVFTAPGAHRLYAERYPDLPPDRLVVIENGYDETAFGRAEGIATGRRDAGETLVLLHSGTVYPSERDPRPLLAAVGELRRRGSLKPGEVKIVMRASGCDDYLRGLIDRNGVADTVVLAPSLPYREALAEMLSVDGLLLMQAANCNYQVPAKLYEYLRARRPVLALTDPDGDTAAILKDAGIDTIAPLDSSDAIARALGDFVARVRAGLAPLAAEHSIVAASRRGRTQALAGMLDGIVRARAEARTWPYASRTRGQ